MADSFELTAEWARQFLASVDSPDARANRRFFDGDHWQNGEGWVGPRPLESAASAVAVRDVMKLIEANFVSKNVVREVVERHASAVVGKEVNWRFVRRDGADPTEADAAAIEAAEAALTAWWDKNDLGSRLLEAVDRMLTSGRSVLRLYVPAFALGQDGVVPNVEGVADSLGLVMVEALSADVAAVYDDHARGTEVAVYVSGDADGHRVVELGFVDADGQTVLRRFDDRDGGSAVESSPLDMGGRVPMVQLERSPLISPQVRQNQRLVNMAVTMMSRNVVLGGFLERTIVNAEMPGEYETDANGRRVFVPKPLMVGAGVTNILQSSLVEDGQGRTTAMPTNVIYRDPVSVSTFVETKRDAQENIYDEVKQRHVLMSGDATASGVSRQQAMLDFEADLDRTKLAVNRAVRTLLETALALATALAGAEQSFLEQYRAVAEARLRVGVPTSESQNMAIALRNAELISAETAMGRVGVEDPVAERQKIRQEVDDDIEAGRARLASGEVSGVPASQFLDRLRQEVAAGGVEEPS